MYIYAIEVYFLFLRKTSFRVIVVTAHKIGSQKLEPFPTTFNEKEEDSGLEFYIYWQIQLQNICIVSHDLSSVLNSLEYLLLV